jgi:hypothetical protein
METWYQRNRDRILKHKREQYSKNPELREKKREQALARYYQRKGLDAPPLIREKGAESTGIQVENGNDFLHPIFLSTKQ